MVRITTSLLALLILSACEDDLPPMVKSPDGTEWWYAITCEGGRRYCMADAERACKHGYEIVDINEGVSERSHGGGVVIGRTVISRSVRTRGRDVREGKHRSSDSP